MQENLPNSIMIKKCSIHQTDDEIYICTFETQLLDQGNKLQCVKCLNLSKTERKHIKNAYDINIEGRENVFKYVEMLNRVIVYNNDMMQKYLQNLNELNLKLNKYFEKQKKLISSMIDQRNTILSDNISRATSLLNEQSFLDSKTIDNFIIFVNLNEEKQKLIEQKYYSMDSIFERQFNFEIAEIQCRVNQLVTINFCFDNVPQYEVEQLKIQKVETKKIFSICQKHQKKKDHLCTHLDCLEGGQQEYFCYSCVQKSHENHIKGEYVKNYNEIMLEQSQKLNMIENQKNNLKQKIQEKIDTKLQAMQQEQQDKFQQYQKIRQNLKILEFKSQNNFIGQNLSFIKNEINFKLLELDQNMIEADFQEKLLIMNEQLKNFITFNQEQLEAQILINDEETFVNRQEFLKLKKQAQQQEIQDIQNKISTISSSKQLSTIENEIQNLTLINQDIKKEIEQLKNVYVSNSLQLEIKAFLDEIKVQILNVPNDVIENDQFQSLVQNINNTQQQVSEIPTQQQDIKNLNSEIGDLKSQVSNFNTILQKEVKVSLDEIKNQILNVPKNVVENDQFKSLQQDINKTQEQVSVIPTQQQDLKNLNNGIGNLQTQVSNFNTILQKEVKVSLDEIKNQILNVPKNVVENDQFKSLQQDINKTQQQVSVIPTQQQDLKNLNNGIGELKFQVSNFNTILQKEVKVSLDEIKNYILSVPKNVIENNSFKSLVQNINNTQQQVSVIPTQQQDLKNLNNGIGDLKSQVSNFNTILQKEVKVSLDEIKNQILIVPKNVIENGQFKSLVQDINQTQQIVSKILNFQNSNPKDEKQKSTESQSQYNKYKTVFIIIKFIFFCINDFILFRYNIKL